MERQKGRSGNDRHSVWRVARWVGVLVAGIALTLGAGCLSSRATAQSTPSEGQVVELAKLSDLLDEQWGVRSKDTPTTSGYPSLWRPAYSPFMPSEWPPTEKTVWVRYAFAYGQDGSLRDAVRVAKPWAKIELRSGSSTATVYSLGIGFEVVDTQGVRPFDAASRVVLARGEDVAAYVLKLTSAPDGSAQETADPVAFYQAWRANNGAIAKVLVPSHAAFWAWVG